MIPKIIHQIWEGRTEYLSDSYLMLAETWKENHPDWKYEFWDEKRIVDFIYNYYPEMVDIYFDYQYNIQRWHVIRYLILYKMGGLYVDFDYECLESFNKYIPDDSKCYFAMEPKQHYHFLQSPFFNNALMATPSGHPFYLCIIDYLKGLNISYKGDKYMEVMTSTGSLALVNLYKKFIYKDTIDFFSSKLVSPFSMNEVKDYIEGKANEGLLEKKMKKAIAIHYFKHSWLINNCSESFSNHELPYTPISELYKIYLQYPLICTDSQLGSEDSLYFAIQSYSKDGNKFSEDALYAGCPFVIVDNPSVVKSNRYILVDNVQQTLQQLADYHHKIMGTPVICITGTCGKTTTKDLIVAILSTRYKLVHTHGSENADLGASLTLLQLKPEHEVAVIELGACCPGMIRELARITRPNYGIITNIGIAHLNGFGSIEAVRHSKCELYDYIRQSGGRIFIYKEDVYLQSVAEGIGQISYGESNDAFVFGQVVMADPCLIFDWGNGEVRYTVSTNMVGEYNFLNFLAAITVGVFFNVSPQNINQAANSYVPTNYRSQWKKTLFNELIIDTFNANPTSMQAALASFYKLKANPKAVILGDMLGLGPESLKFHAQIIERLNEYCFEKVILCGDQFAATNSAYFCLHDVEALHFYFSTCPIKGYSVLIKGSNKIHLETIVNLL